MPPLYGILAKLYMAHIYHLYANRATQKQTLPYKQRWASRSTRDLPCLLNLPLLRPRLGGGSDRTPRSEKVEKKKERDMYRSNKNSLQ